MIDTFDGYDSRCKECGHDPSHPYHAPGEEHQHAFQPIQHNVSVTWVSRWEVTCQCGFKITRGIDSKLTAELATWLHLRRWDTTRAKEFAANRDITDLAYKG